jgi:hypothetical protein
MKYLCLRVCFVSGSLWQKGAIYDLPDEMNKDPKNFQPVEVLEKAKESLESGAEMPKGVDRGKLEDAVNLYSESTQTDNTEPEQVEEPEVYVSDKPKKPRKKKK